MLAPVTNMHYQQDILQKTAFVKSNAAHVHLNKTKLHELANEILTNPQEINREWTDLDFKYHFTDGTERTAQWLFLSSALNFSFWDGKAEELWKVEFDGAWVEGYWALTASLKKAMAKYDILDATFLENMTSDILSDIFKGKDKPPLIEKRVQVCRNIGKVLNEKFGGHFKNVLKLADGSAVVLTNIVAENFTDFHDISTYKVVEVPILKRAQILAADIWGAFKGEGLGHFYDLDQVTIFADYKLPQFLRAMGVMTYSDELANKVDNFELIEQGSEMEIEIRALTIQAVEELRILCKGTYSVIQLDWWIWHASFSDKYKDIQQPHHLTRSVYY